MTALRKRMLEDLQRRNYNPDTIRGYVLAVEQFANHFDKSPELMGVEEVGQFQLHLLREKKLALGTIALRMGALRFLYRKGLRRNLWVTFGQRTDHGPTDGADRVVRSITKPIANERSERPFDGAPMQTTQKKHGGR